MPDAHHRGLAGSIQQATPVRRVNPATFTTNRDGKRFVKIARKNRGQVFHEVEQIVSASIAKNKNQCVTLTRFLSGTSILVESRWLPSAPVGAVSYGWHRQECPCYITKCTKPTLPHHPCRNPVKPPL